VKFSGIILSVVILVFAFTSSGLSNNQVSGGDDIHQLWIDCRLKDVVSFEIFKMGILGYRKIVNLKKKNLITIIDFSMPSTQQRFFVIELEKKKVIYSCYVAHGKNSGDNYAKSFSNQSGSLKSSPGFYLTAETYTGKHGYSLKLDGL
jgi:hypothetical protein